jgi:hypothetical protein
MRLGRTIIFLVNSTNFLGWIPVCTRLHGSDAAALFHHGDRERLSFELQHVTFFFCDLCVLCGEILLLCLYVPVVHVLAEAEACAVSLW